MGNGVDLVRPQGNTWVHAYEAQMTAIVFTGAHGVELFVIEPAQHFPARRVLPDPVCKGRFDHLLFALGDGSFFFIQYRCPFSIGILDIIKDTHIPEIQGFFNDFIAVDSCCTIGAMGFHITPVIGFSLDVPFAGVAGVMDMDVPSAVIGCPEQFKHEVLHHIGGEPGRT